MSYSPSSSSNSPSSSAVASWYCWYSLTKSLRFDSASVNSISSMPSPVYQQEGLAAEHARVLLGNALEHLLDCRGVADESNGHLQPLGWNVADADLHVVRNPLDEVARVLVLDVKHLLVDLLARHAPTVETARGEEAAVPRVRSAHHILRIKHLLGPT